METLVHNDPFSLINGPAGPKIKFEERKTKKEKEWETKDRGLVML